MKTWTGVAGVVLAMMMTAGATTATAKNPAPTELWTLKRDYKADHAVNQPVRERLELTILGVPRRKTMAGRLHQQQINGRFQRQTLANGKKTPTTFHGEIVHGKSQTVIALRQTEHDGAFHVTTYTGRAIAPNLFRGTWYDTAGNAGDFDLAKESSGIDGVNIAAGKSVTSNRPHRAGRAATRLNDGLWSTDAFPSSTRFDYTIQLTTPRDGKACVAPRGFDVDAIAIYWGHYGRHYPGGTGRGSWEGDYVKAYTLEYLDTSDTWHTLHKHKGLPTNEASDQTTVTRFPADAPYDSGEVLTVLDDLDLTNVLAIRLRAKGGHWIGVYELEVYGSTSAPAAKSPKLVRDDPHADALDTIIKRQGAAGTAPAFQLTKPAASLDTTWPIIRDVSQRKVVAMGEHDGWLWFDITVEGHVFGYYVRKGGRDVYHWSRW